MVSARSVEKTIRMVKALTLFRGEGELIRPLLIADEEYLNAAFDAINREWGSFEAYAAHGLELNGADIQSLRDKLLE